MSDDALLGAFGAGDPEFPLIFIRRFQAHVSAVTGESSLAEDVARTRIRARELRAQLQAAPRLPPLWSR